MVTEVEWVPWGCYSDTCWQCTHWFTWEVITGVEGIPWRGLLQHTLTDGTLVYPSQGGRYCAWHCSSVITDPLGESSCTLLYVGLPSTWGWVDGDSSFSPHFVGVLLTWGLQEIWMNRPMALEMEQLLHRRNPRVDFKSLSPLLGWEVIPWSLNIIWRHLTWPFFYAQRAGFVAQRILWPSKGFSNLQVAHGRNRGLRLGFMGLIQSSSFL
jgi:hypothetical protein